MKRLPTTKLWPKLEDLLIAAIPRAIRKATARAPSPLWCCALLFDSSLPDACLPPELRVVTVREREKTLKDNAKAGGRYIWACQQYDNAWTAWLTGRPLLAACRKATDEIVERDNAAPVAKLLVKVARRLNDLPLASFGKVAEDFVVYAFDANQPATALVASSLSPKQAAAFRKRKLL